MHPVKDSARLQLEIKDLTKDELKAKMQEQLRLLKQLRVTVHKTCISKNSWCYVTVAKEIVFKASSLMAMKASTEKCE